MKRKVLVVDDSRSMGQFLTAVLNKDPDLQVVGQAFDPFEARDMIKKINPDVLTLDVEMPRMDGITFLRNLMRLHPMPVVMLSSLTSAGAEVTLDALALGAVDFAVKRHPGTPEGMEAYARDIRSRVRAAALVDKPATEVKSSDHKRWVAGMLATPAASADVHRVIAIGASTGGPAALGDVFGSLDLADSCAVISQHMPSHFMNAFARRLDTLGSCHVKEAEEGEVLMPGTAYVAPGDKHLTVCRKGLHLHALISDEAKRNDHRPSVDVMYESVARAVGSSAVAVLLTGMGVDGAAGMELVKRRGGLTVAQDEASSVVWGMPGSAVRDGSVDAVLSLGAIAPLINEISKCSLTSRAQSGAAKVSVNI